MSGRGGTPDPVEVGLHLAGRVRWALLAAPTAGEAITDIRTSPPTGKDLVFLVLGMIDTLDGEAPGYVDAVAVVEDGAALAALADARNRWLGAARLDAVVAARCPHCRRHEVRLSLHAVALALGCPPPDWVAPGGVALAVPAITEPAAVPDRGPVPRAGRLRVELPSARLGLSPRVVDAVLADADDARAAERRERIWLATAPPGSIPPADRGYRHAGSVGYAAIVRLSAALERLGGREVSPDDVERLAVVDFLCLDAAHHLLFSVPAPRPETLVVTCQGCGGEFRSLGPPSGDA